MQQHAPMKAYVLVKNQPHQVQNENIQAAKSVASLVKTCLGPNAMQKMVMTRIGSIELTNDGNAILREIEIAHPAAKSLVELARTQDDEVGDGTTSVIILAAEVLSKVAPLLEIIHPIKITQAIGKALNLCVDYLKTISFDLKKDENEILKIVGNAVGTKLCAILKIPVEKLALKVVKTILNEESGSKKVDLKNDVRVEKILGANPEESEVLEGVLIEKTIYHPEMRTRIENPRVLVIDTGLEYKKGESQTNYEFRTHADFTKALEIETEQVKSMCDLIIALKPDIVLTEKGICDYALGYLQKHNITAIRRIKKSESNRLIKTCGGFVASRLEDLSEKCVGLNCGLFEYVKFGEDFYCKFSKCAKPKACTVILRGPSRDLLNEIERNFYDAVKVAKNLTLYPKMCVGGGATEMALSLCMERAKGNENEEKVFSKIAEALKIIPTILSRNSGHYEPLSLVAELEKKQKENKNFGIDGVKGVVCNMNGVVMEPLMVKQQMVKSAFEAACLILRVDGIVQSQRRK